MLKVLLVIGDATEVLDTMYPFFRLPEDGFEVVVAGPEKKLYHMVLHEIPPGSTWDITQETAGYHLQADIAFRDVKPDEYAGLFLSGGRAPEYLRYDQDLLRITRDFFEKNKPVASVCHGIEIVAAADCLKGRTATTVAKCARHHASRRQVCQPASGGRWQLRHCSRLDGQHAVRERIHQAAESRPVTGGRDLELPNYVRDVCGRVVSELAARW